MKEYKLKINNNSYTVVINDVTDDAVLAEVNGTQHVVEIDTIASLSPLPSSETAATVSASAVQSSVTSAAQPAASPASKAGSGSIVTPIPGQIISISVALGEKVRTGQKLLVLEAMKLENSITATMDGTIQEILVKEGDVVGQGQDLIVIK